MKWIKVLFPIVIFIGCTSCSPSKDISKSITSQPTEILTQTTAIIVPSQIPPSVSKTLKPSITPENRLTLPLRVPILAIAYFPPNSAGPTFLDYSETGWSNIPVTDMQTATKDMIDAGLVLISDATRYHGYKNPDAPQYLDYYLYQLIEYFYPIPRGYPLGGTEFRPHYNQILNEIDICDIVDNHGIKEVWIYGYHTSVIVPDESKMSSKYGDVSNALPKDEYIPAEFQLPRCTNSYVMYNFTYQPGGANAIGNTIHNRLHQIENVVFFAENKGYPVNENNVVGSLFWDDFSVIWDHASLPGYRASCGNTHSPPNTTEGYDYDSVEYRENNCESWNPDDTLTTYESANCTQWGCTDVGFYKWFMQNLPGYDNGIIYKGKPMRNWWDAMYDFEKYIDEDKTDQPSISTTSTSGDQQIIISPPDSQILKYGENWHFKVDPNKDSQGYLWGFFQNGELIWENMRDAGVLSSSEYTILADNPIQNRFDSGPIEVMVRALVNGGWSDATILTFILE